MSKIFVDIDNTICETNSMNYNLSIPIKKNIKIVNDLFDNGYNITYWTARGTRTGIDHKELTKKQLKQWGAKYHNLILGKPDYDILIDDKAINTLQQFYLVNNVLNSHK